MRAEERDTNVRDTRRYEQVIVISYAILFGNVEWGHNERVHTYA